MAGTIQKIKEDLSKLENQTSVLYPEIRELYKKYLEELSQAIKKQLVLAVYQLCTQAYPQNFLRLSYSQRQKLQETIRNLSRETKEKLMGYLQEKPQISAADFQLIEQIFLNLPQAENEEKKEKSEIQIPRDISSIEEIKINNPEELFLWVRRIEQGIISTLEHLSREANKTLQQFQVLPGNLPPQVLEMAIQAEEAGQPMSGSPNLLNILVETSQKHGEEEDTEAEQPGQITKIIAIHLRLGEIEFATPSLGMQRKQIRSFLENLGQMRKHYHKKQHELTIAEAESAWRASWYDD